MLEIKFLNNKPIHFCGNITYVLTYQAKLLRDGELNAICMQLPKVYGRHKIWIRPKMNFR